MLIENERGDRLLSLASCDEAELEALAPLTHALVVARHAGRNLLVFNRHRQNWELAGGMIDPGESPRACAVRELREESGLICPSEALRFSGFTKLLLQPSKFNPSERIEYGALYVVDVERINPFVANEEISDVCWWDGGDLTGELDAIDRKLTQLV